MLRLRCRCLQLFILLAMIGWSANMALAHPGHGPVPETVGPVHYLLSPMHWGVVALVLAILIAAAWYTRLVRHERRSNVG